MQTRDQKYASDAYERVKEVADAVTAQKKSESFGRAYGSMAHKLPILIHVSGLAQALAFVDSRGKDKSSGQLLGSGKLLEDLSRTVLGEPAARLLQLSRGDTQESNLREYIYLTEQTLSALLWYKRYAQSILHIEQGDEDDEDADEKGMKL
jgi:CRISPR-associated protein Cmr5